MANGHEEPFNAREYLLDESGVHRKVEALLRDLKGGGVFFYPSCCRGGEVDLQPLHRLSHLCKVFIYADESLDQQMVADAIGGIRLRAVGDGLRQDEQSIPIQVANAGFPALAALNAALQGDDAAAAYWIGAASLLRRISDVEYPIWIIFLAGNWIEAYQHLFSGQNQAPRVLCVRNLVDDAHQPQAAAWDGPLGTLIAEGLDHQQPVPELIISDHPLHDWPWTSLWQKYVGWGMDEAAKGYVRPAVPHAAAVLADNGGTRTITIRQGLFHAADAGNCDAALVSLEMFQTWVSLAPNLCLLVDCERIEITEETARRQVLIPFPVRGIPMEAVLLRLEHICARFELQRVVSIPFGFEDEGPALAAWRRRAGNPLQLTIHCAHEGDLVSLTGCADEIIEA